MALRRSLAASLPLFLVLIVSQICISRSAALQASVLTYHNDNQRTGANTAETTLTPANVNVQTFGKLYSARSSAYEVPICF